MSTEALSQRVANIRRNAKIQEAAVHQLAAITPDNPLGFSNRSIEDYDAGYLALRRSREQMRATTSDNLLKLAYAAESDTVQDLEIYDKHRRQTSRVHRFFTVPSLGRLSLRAEVWHNPKHDENDVVASGSLVISGDVERHHTDPTALFIARLGIQPDNPVTAEELARETIQLHAQLPDLRAAVTLAGLERS